MGVVYNQGKRGIVMTDTLYFFKSSKWFGNNSAKKPFLTFEIEYADVTIIINLIHDML